MVSVEMLERSSIFTGLDRHALQSIAKACSTHNYRASEKCLNEGEPANNFFILMSGKMSIERRLPQSWLHAEGITDAWIDTVNEGEVFGWSAVVEPSVRTASVHCKTACEVIVVNGKELLDILDKHPESGYVFMKRLASVITSRLSTTAERLMELTAEVETYKVM